MEALALWISNYAIALWALVLIVALVCGDFLWRRARRHRLATTGKRDYLALEPGTAAALLAVFGGVFGLLFWAVWTHSALTRFDAALALDLHHNLSPEVLQGVVVFTWLGDPQLVTVSALIVALLLALRRQWRLFIPWGVGLGGMVASNDVVKRFMQRARPFNGHGFITETGFSFPSGHAAGSLVFFGLLAYLLLRQCLPRHHRDTVAVAVALVTLIGFSRVMLQVHYLSDVLAGYALGACWLVIAMALAEQLRRGAPTS